MSADIYRQILSQFADRFLFPRLLSVSPLGSPQGAELVETASRTVVLIVGVLVLTVLIPVVFLVYRKFFSTLRDVKPVVVDPAAEIARLEKKGDFHSAASRCASHGDHRRAADLYEKARDLANAAEQFELAGDLKKAANLHVRSGGSTRAAGLYIKTGDYMEAAKIFRNKGDHLRSAQALELFGNKAAAAREFVSAGQFDRAARLFKLEGLYADAADAYGNFLSNQELGKDNVDRFYGLAGLLALADRGDEAAEIYRSILHLKGDYRKARGNLRALGFTESGDPRHRAASPENLPPAGDPATAAAPPSPTVSPSPDGIDEGDALSAVSDDRPGRETTLRNMIAYGRLEPRYSMRIWFQILKALSVKHHENIFFGCLRPEDIEIDMENNVTINTPDERFVTYTAPEVLAGQAAGPHSDIYALGVILFEMITGSLSRLGSARPSEIREDVPAWLDDLVIGCTKKDRRDRYLNVEDVSAKLVRLKSRVS